MCFERGLDLAQLDTKTAHFSLMITPAQKLNFAVWK